MPMAANNAKRYGAPIRRNYTFPNDLHLLCSVNGLRICRIMFDAEQLLIREVGKRTALIVRFVSDAIVVVQPTQRTTCQADYTYRMDCHVCSLETVIDLQLAIQLIDGLLLLNESDRIQDFVHQL